jgi:glycosyltransferase involved in cell wall biosynthesis
LALDVLQAILCMETNNVFLVKVLFVGPYSADSKGGVSAVIENYYHYFRNVGLFSTQPFSRNYLNHLVFPFLILRLLFKLNKGQYKIIHIHGASYGSFFRKSALIFVSKRFSNAKVVYHIHGGEFQLFYERSGRVLKWLIRKTLHKADFVICLSLFWKSLFENIFNLIDVGVVNNIVPYPEEGFEKLTRNKASSKINFLFFGRIGSGKGVFDLLNVVNEHRTYLLNRIELVVGGNGEVQKFQRFIASNHLGNLVKYVGWVRGVDKARYLAESDVFILPSYHEGLPISILEAMSYGLAIISTPVGGIPEIVNDNGILVEPGNQKELFAAIDYCIKNDLSVMSDNSRKSIGAFYPQSVFAQLSDIYKKVMGE